MAIGARKFLLVGLTGGIATGKSTVSEMLRRRGAVIIDADLLAREVVEPGEPALATIAEEFGRDVLQPDGRLDRKKLGAVIFAEPARRKRLEGITHPAIRDRFARRLVELAQQGFAGLVFFDAAVMIESGNYKNMDRMLVVAASEDVQLARLMARDGIDRDAAMQRVRSQMPLAEKVALADYVIWNDGDRAETEAQVEQISEALLQEQRAALGLIGCAAALGVVFVVNMEHYRQNRIDPTHLLRRLATKSAATVRFVGYHWRPSGNFVFLDESAEARRQALQVVERATNLRCIGRGFPDLVRIARAAPAPAIAPVARRQGGRLTDPRPVMAAVLLSDPLPEKHRMLGSIRRDVGMCRWASPSDVVCRYARPRSGGSIGQVAGAVVRAVIAAGASPDLYATGRTIGVIEDILNGAVRSGSR